MRRCLFSILMTVLLAAPTVMARARDEEESSKPEGRSVTHEWLIGSVFLVGCLVVAFKPAKRANLR